MGAGKLGAFVEGARGIDLPGFSLSPVPATFVFGAVAVCRAPLAGGVEGTSSQLNLKTRIGFT